MNPYQPDFKRFHIFQDGPSEFSLMDEGFGRGWMWVWKNIKSRSSVLRMMQILTPLEFRDEEYKRLRRLEGDEWERELAN